MRAARAFWLVAALAGLLALAVIGAVGFLDTQAGRDFAVRQLPLYAPKSGLTVAVGRIDGSLFGTATLHDVALGDPKGVFARARRVDLQWRPFDLLRNRLSVASLSSPEVDVLRRPALRPSADKRILPDIDVTIGKLSLPRIVLAAPVVGTPRIVGLSGNADIVHGRAKLALAANAADAGDAVRLALDAEPDRDRFDLDAHVVAPKGGVITGLLGLTAPLAVDVAGKGRWTAWRGHIGAKLGDAPLLDLALGNDAGRFTAAGAMMPAGMVGGMAARMAGPSMRLDATATLADRRADSRFTLRSQVVAMSGAGDLDFGTETFSGVTLDLHVLRPAALHPRLAARDLVLRARVAGSFVNPIVDYVATAPALSFGPTGFVQLRAIGIVQLGSRPLTVPVAASAARVTGFGPEADALLTNVRATGPLIVRGNTLVADALILRSDRATARATAQLDLATGGYVATAKAAVPHYTLVGLGLADITADVRITPVGDKSRVAGVANVHLTRLDNKTFATQLEGLPSVVAPIVLQPGGELTFTAARLASPGLNLVVSGARSPAGIVTLAGTGASRRYGPLTVKLAGPIATPVVDLTLARPGLGMGLADVAAHVVPANGNWGFDVRGTTSYGPVTARGVVRGVVEPAPIDLAALTLAGVTAHGSVVQLPAGPLAGRLELGGSGLAGHVTLAAAGTVQRADVAVTAANAKLALGQPVSISRGELTATVLLPDTGPQATGRFSVTGLRRADVVVTQASGTVDYARGHGTAHFEAAGQAQSPFSLAGSAALGNNRLEVSGSGTFSGRKVGLAAPAVLTRDGTDWVLAPATVTTPDGRAELSGRFGSRNAVHAKLQNLGLSLLTLAGSNLDFGGRVSGTIDAALAPGGLPTGTAAIRISGLSRAGLASASLPIDVALNAQLGESGGSARAVIVRAGVVEGRLQAQLRGIPATGPMVQRLLAAALVAQARYVGPAQALWPLAGVEAVDVKGPVTISADIGGTLGSPTLAGTIVSDGARVENVTLGTVVEKAHLDSHFTASRLDLTSFSGTVGKGSVTGSGTIGLSADDGFPLDIRLVLKDAAALKRDDLAATVTGDLHLVSNRDGGKISGKLTADRAKFRIGRPAQAEVPVLAVRETGSELVRRRVVSAEKPTRWALDIAVAGERINVEGMGLQSDWRGDIVLRGTPTAPALSGRVRLIRGDYDFAGKRFQLTRGDLRFTGEYPPDPIIDIAAENTQSSFTATLTITGTGLRPEIAFSSVPALPQDEVLSRVLFGTSIASLSAPEALQLAGALTSLRGGKGDGLNPINLVRRKLGIDRLRILPANTTTGQKTAIAAGQYIGRRVYVELASDAQGYTATNIEVSLTRSLSILSQVATLGGTSASLRLKKDY